jgi:hypothetical protein
MHIYKFRMIAEENDNFIRDFEIKAAQTFEDFHNIIAESVKLNGNELASFHICDQKWNKLQEITLIEMMDGSEEEENTKHIEETHVMSKSVIRDFINEPSQRLLYEYDFLNMKTFYIELLSVFKQKDDAQYPRCITKRGEIIEQVQPEDAVDDEELRNQLLQDFEDMMDDTLDNPQEYL